MKQILFLSFLLFSSFLYSQKSTFVFSGLDEKEMDFFNSLQISVNKIPLSIKNKKYKITINKAGLDTIKIVSQSEQIESQTILTKLRTGETYTIIFNPCSMFEIRPAKEREGLKLVRLITQNKDSTKLFLNSFYCFVDPLQIEKRDTTDYFPNASSGYCPYAVNSFNVCENDIDEIMDNIEAYKKCHGLILYFSGQEMYSIIYDHQTKAIKVQFDGYYDESKKIKIPIQ